MYGGDTATFKMDEEDILVIEDGLLDDEEGGFFEAQEGEDDTEEEICEAEVLVRGQWRRIFDSLEMYFREMQQYKVLSEEDERALLTSYLKTGNTEARERLILCNWRLVVKIAKPYAQQLGIPLLTLIQEGNIGLMCAIRKFSFEKGSRLMTYAVWWIEEVIRRSIMNTHRMIRMPVRAQKVLVKIRKAQKRAMETRGYKLTPKEICAELGIGLDRLKEVEEGVTSIVSMDNVLPGGDEDGDVLGDMISNDAMLQDERMHAKDLRMNVILPALNKLGPKHRFVMVMRAGMQGIIFSLAEIKKALHNKNFQLELGEAEQMEVLLLQKLAPPKDVIFDRRAAERWLEKVSREALTPQEDTVFMLRYGIGVCEHSLEGIADRVNLTRERVRQIEEKAIKRMRTHLEYGVLRNERRQGICLEKL